MLATGTSSLMRGEGNQGDERVDTCASPRLYPQGTTPVGTARNDSRSVTQMISAPRDDIFGVYLVSVFVGHQGDVVELERSNRIALRLSMNAVKEVIH